MRKLRRITLSNLSKVEMTEKEQNLLRGGSGAGGTCVCVCLEPKCACGEIKSSGYYHDSVKAFNDNGGSNVENGEARANQIEK
ncbi:TIGR04149 family rSAM-modified RiPP [Bacteroides sp. 519]|uniref:TIGR04149 family rSAM-modified RiPP n=1 Tax=Bacteroides sp. 519 TaxID=2302937 RepID=UPI0013D22C68|nr:TIGR04149 family rSAM-modified RiPP [Bacteroides sp. 519]NDV60764.1 rSAM-modified peptide [Bacteroides sp. 519]